MLQLTFELPRRTAFGRADFLVSACNASAVGWIDRWPDWPGGAVLIQGEAGCGKTHLVHLWCERASAVSISGEDLDDEMVARLLNQGQHRIAIDGADRAAQRHLLHLYNWCLESGGSVLITACRRPAFWATLPDLGSRLRAALSTEIGPPDDALLAAVLVKHFADRQVRVAPEVVLFLVAQIERSFAAAAAVAELLDAVSLRDGRAITVPLVREVLAGLNDHSRPPSESGVK
jgi:chromosomal replication initiation ATPase DnaA